MLRKKTGQSHHSLIPIGSTLTAAAACCTLASPLLAEDSQGDDNSYNPPKYQTLRFNEDWSGMPQNYGDWSDRLKKINLDDHGENWLSMGGQVRVRGELWRGFGFNDNNDDEFALFRFFGWMDLHLGENIRVFVQPESTHATNRDLPGGKRATLDVDSADLLDAFAEFSFDFGDDYRFSVRGGRQELLFGKQRLISPLDWSNNRRTFDGFSATLKPTDGNWKLDAFLTQLVRSNKYRFDGTDDNVTFYGIYFNEKVGEDQKYDVDAYLLGLHTDLTVGDSDRFTAGARMAGPIAEGFSFDAEGAYQFGSTNGLDIGAWMFAGDLNYLFADYDSKPKITLGIDLASGDDDPTDTDSGTFNQLFPLGHAYLGYIDVVGRQNIMDYRASASFWPAPKKLQVKADVHFFERMESQDALYNAGGGVVRAGAAGTDESVGTEIDLTAKYLLDRHTVISGGYSHFFAGDFLDDAPPSDDIDFVWLQYQFTF